MDVDRAEKAIESLERLSDVLARLKALQGAVEEASVAVAQVVQDLGAVGGTLLERHESLVKFEDLVGRELPELRLAVRGQGAEFRQELNDRMDRFRTQVETVLADELRRASQRTEDLVARTTQETSAAVEACAASIAKLHADAANHNNQVLGAIVVAAGALATLSVFLP